jgi:hypothetical protein
VQLVFYRADEEFPAAARLRIDQAAVNFLEFEFNDGSFDRNQINDKPQ